MCLFIVSMCIIHVLLLTNLCYGQCGGYEGYVGTNVQPAFGFWVWGLWTWAGMGASHIKPGDSSSECGHVATGRPLEYLKFSLTALIREPIY